MILKTIVASVLLLLCSNVWATDYYIKDSATGTGDGLSVANAASRVTYSANSAPFNALTTVDTVYVCGSMTTTLNCNTTGGHTLRGDCSTPADWTGSSGSGIACIDADDVTIKKTTVNDVAYTGIIYTGGDRGIVEYNYVTNCGGATSNDDGIFIGNGSQSLIVRHNTVTGQLSSGGTGIDFSGDSTYGYASAIIHDNTVSGTVGRAMSASGDADNGDTAIFFNNTTDGGAQSMFLYQCGTFYLYNNTFIDGVGGNIIVSPPGGACTGVVDTKMHATVKNNISSFINIASAAIAITNSTNVDYVGSNNIFWRKTSIAGNLSYFDGVAKGITDWRTLTSQDANSIESDPLLQSNYRLTPSSPAINTGLDICTDKWGTACDIGAYELHYGVFTQ